MTVYYISNLQVEAYTLNPFWGVEPDYSKISIGRSNTQDKSEHV